MVRISMTSTKNVAMELVSFLITRTFIFEPFLDLGCLLDPILDHKKYHTCECRGINKGDVISKWGTKSPKFMSLPQRSKESSSVMPHDQESHIQMCQLVIQSDRSAQGSVTSSSSMTSHHMCNTHAPNHDAIKGNSSMNYPKRCSSHQSQPQHHQMGATSKVMDPCSLSYTLGSW
jgi:hypothetical protein